MRARNRGAGSIHLVDGRFRSAGNGRNRWISIGSDGLSVGLRRQMLTRVPRASDGSPGPAPFPPMKLAARDVAVMSHASGSTNENYTRHRICLKAVHELALA